MSTAAPARARFGAETDESGRSVRQVGRFRDRVTGLGDAIFTSVVDRVAETVDDLDHTARHHLTHDTIDPRGIVPKGPELDLSLPHGRG